MISKKENLDNAQEIRQKAEAKLKERHRKMGRPETEIEVKKLVHELEVHQIELEMQYEELRQANETAELALKKYTMLFDFAPMGYFTLNAEGLIQDLNFTGAELLGEKRFKLENANFKLFVSENSLPVFNQFFDRVFQGDTKVSCEVVLGCDNELFHHVYMEGIVIEDEKECLLSVVDISSLKK